MERDHRIKAKMLICNLSMLGEKLLMTPRLLCDGFIESSLSS